MTIHIPDEVRKAALAELNNAFLGSMEDKMAAVLTAALQAWPGTGMAKSGFSYPFAEDRPDNWIADSGSHPRTKGHHMTEVSKHIDVIKIGILIGLAGVEKDVRISELTDEEGAAIATAAHAALVEAGFVVMPGSPINKARHLGSRQRAHGECWRTG